MRMLVERDSVYQVRLQARQLQFEFQLHITVRLKFS